MKVQCPNCNAGYNIDDKIISDAGIYAICNCENRFLVMKDSGKAAAETRIQEKSKTDIAPKKAQKAPKKVEEAPKKTEKALKAADGKQKTGKESDEIRKTLKYTTLAVTLSYALLFGIYHFYFSQNKISLTHKFIEVFESLKLRFMRQS